MFLDNKYTTWYYKIVDKARNRVIEGYVERHHIVPTCLGGSNDLNNLVDLTAREHYICHWLLTKMVSVGTNQKSLMRALWAMSNQKGKFRSDRNYTIPSHIYETRRKMSASLMRELNTGRKYPKRKSPNYSEEERLKRRNRLIELNKSRTGRALTDTQKEKIRKARAKQDVSYLVGRSLPEETRSKISETLKKRHKASQKSSTKNP